MGTYLQCSIEIKFVISLLELPSLCTGRNALYLPVHNKPRPILKFVACFSVNHDQ